MTSLGSSEADILAAVSAMLRDVIGEEWIQTKVIDMSTTFSQDLEVESIEIVQLAEKIQEKYGAIDLPSWLASKDLDEIIGLTVGDLVKFISSCQ
jgi:acyl carrier protein